MIKLQDCLGDRYSDFEALDSVGKASFVLGNELWEEHFDSLLGLVKDFIISIWEERKRRLYGENECAQQPSPQSPAGDLGDIGGVGVQNGKFMCQGGKTDTGVLHSHMCVCGSAHSCGCMVDGDSARAAN